LISSAGFGRLAVALAALCGTVSLGNFRATRPAPADLIVLHGRICTVNARQPWAEALAISSDKIVAVGSEKEIEKYRGPRTQTIDAAGQVVLPGFTDSHNHFLEGSLSLDEPDLNTARSSSDVRQILKSYASSHPGKGWVFGQGWSYDVFAPSGLPDKGMLDEIFSNRPVYLESFDGHTAWVNSSALTLARINRDTPDPPTGKIVRDAATNDATGALKEDARHLVKGLVPSPTSEDKLSALRKGLALANQYGLVRVHAAGEPPDTFGDFFDLDLFEQLRREGRLSVRFYVSRVIDPPQLAEDELASLEDARIRYHDNWISVGAAKFFLDGVIEAHTAAMISPYSDDPNISGSTLWTPDKFNAAVAQLDKRGFQIFTHAIGDRAVRLALNAYQNAEVANGRRDARHRVEHVEVVSSDDLPRFAALGVIASMQPLHAYPDAGVWSVHVGPERQKLGFAWNSLQKAGAHLAFGSDWEVVTMNPWPGIQCAVTRQTDAGQPQGGWIPEQRISVAQAIAGYTIGAAYAGHRETTEGSLETGKVADLIVISQNPFEIDPLKIGKTEVVLTIVGGRVVYRSANGPSLIPSKVANIPGDSSKP
jgi:predicted amidohydrolase YtcJ